MEENKPDPIIMKLLTMNPDTYYWYKTYSKAGYDNMG